jgi:foldase protein PrsA
MTRARTKLALALAVAGAGAGVVAGCGNDVPTGAVAKVGDSTITKSEFDKWLRTVVTGQAQGGTAAVPDPPDFTRCVAAKQKQPTPKGTEKPSATSLKKQCDQEFDQLKGEVMQFLIQSQWVQQEADAQDIKVSDAEVKRSFADQKKQAFPNDKAYREYLESSGLSEQDILFRVKLDTLQQKLTQKVTEKESKISGGDVEDYYAKNKKRFAQPERRNLNVVLTKTKAKAEQAKRQLDRGAGFKTVAKRFSIDEASKTQGGKLPDVARGQQEKPLDTAVFRAKRDRIQGPVKTQFGFYVFEVTKITPASQQSLEEARDTIRNLLRSQRQQKALDSFIKSFREDYKDKTICADDFRVAECDNAPESVDTGPASGGTPRGPTPQGQPGGGQGQPVPVQPQPGGAPQGGAPQGGAPQPQPQGPASP